MLRVLVAGEGTNDIGRWAHALPYRETAGSEGVVVALLRKRFPTGWEVADGVRWKDVAKYVGKKIGGAAHRAKEQQTVLRLALRAKERGFDALVFVRDRDNDTDREEEIEALLRDTSVISRDFENAPPVVGAVAVERLESWVLAVTGRHRTETFGDATVDGELLDIGVAAKDGPAMERIVDVHGLEKAPKDAVSLHRFLERAETVLGATHR